MSIHTQIKLRRKALGLSQGDLAAAVSQLERGRTPLTWQTVQQWENGSTAPARKRLPFVAKALKCEVNDLLEQPAASRAGTAPPPPPRNFSDRKTVSDTDYDLLQDIKIVMSDEQQAELRKQAERIRRVAGEQLGRATGNGPKD